MKATLFVIPGSHPCVAARLMLERKGVEYKRVDLMPVVSKGVVKAQRFPTVTVPALKLDGRRVQGTRDIASALDELRPDPSLMPADPDQRARVEDAERWADTELQELARRTLWWALRHDRAPMATYAEGARMGIPVGVAVKTGQPIVSLAARLNKATDGNVQRDLAGLPAALDRIDGFIADGTLGGAQPTLADYQVASCVRLLMTLDDLLPLIDGRPAADHARSLVPDYPGHIPAGALPAEWLSPAGQRTS